MFLLQNLILLCQKNIRLNSTHYFVMKIPNKRELQQITINHSSDIDFRDFMNLYKKCTAKLHSFLVIHAILASDNPSRFREDILEGIWKAVMITDDKIRNEKSQFDINRAAKISALLSGKIDKYEYPTGEEVLPSNQRQTIAQAKFTYSPLGKAFEKQTKKQVGAIKYLDFSDKRAELKQIEGIFPHILTNDLIRDKWTEMVNLQNI